jgi:hypothetical protein
VHNSAYGQIPRYRATPGTNRRALMGDNVVRITRVRRPASGRYAWRLLPPAQVVFSWPRHVLGHRGPSPGARAGGVNMLSSSHWNLVHIHTHGPCADDRIGRRGAANRAGHADVATQWCCDTRRTTSPCSKKDDIMRGREYRRSTKQVRTTGLFSWHSPQRDEPIMANGQLENTSFISGSFSLRYESSHSRSPTGPQPSPEAHPVGRTYQVQWHLLATHAALLDRT